MLANLIRLLGSDTDGEALGAARALKRVLKAHGADFHTLAALIEAPSTAPNGGVNHFGDDRGAPNWQTMVAVCIGRFDQFTAKEQQFLKTMQRWRGKPTAKQLKWLTDLFDWVRRAA
jgi:hypothetical protein